MRHDCHKDREALWSYRGGQDTLSVSERIKGITSVAGQVDAKTVDPGQLTFGISSVLCKIVAWEEQERAMCP